MPRLRTHSHHSIIAPSAQEKAEAVARGGFQKGLLRGVDSLSLATLQGKARSYGGHYARSRDNLLVRLNQAGLNPAEAKGPAGHRLLLVGYSTREEVERALPEGYRFFAWLGLGSITPSPRKR